MSCFFSLLCPLSSRLSSFIFSCLVSPLSSSRVSSLIFHLLVFPFLLFSFLFFSCLVSSSLFLSCLFFSCLVSSLFLCLSVSVSVSVSLCLSLCGVVWCVWCPRVYVQKNLPCVRSKRPPCVPAPRAHVLPHAGVVAGTTRDVLNIHTEGFFCTLHTGERGRGERGGGGSPSVLLTKKSPRRVLTWPHKFTERNCWILPIRSLRIDREQLAPESSNHSLHLMNLFIFSNLED